MDPINSFDSIFWNKIETRVSNLPSIEVSFWQFIKNRLVANFRQVCPFVVHKDRDIVKRRYVVNETAFNSRTS